MLVDAPGEGKGSGWKDAGNMTLQKEFSEVASTLLCTAGSDVDYIQVIMSPVVKLWLSRTELWLPLRSYKGPNNLYEVSEFATLLVRDLPQVFHRYILLIWTTHCPDD